MCGCKAGVSRTLPSQAHLSCSSFDLRAKLGQSARTAKELSNDSRNSARSSFVFGGRNGPCAAKRCGNEFLRAARRQLGADAVPFCKRIKEGRQTFCWAQ